MKYGPDQCSSNNNFDAIKVTKEIPKFAMIVDESWLVFIYLL